MEANFPLKIISKEFAFRLKTLLLSVIFSQETAYIEKRFIGESGRLVYDILSVTINLKIKGYLVIMDIDKAFESLDHSFLISVLKKLDLENISLIGSKYCYTSKYRAYWKSILILKNVLIKVMRLLHIYLSLH